MRLLIVAMLSVGFFGCAKPRYVPAKDTVSGQAASCARQFSNGLCVDLRWERQPVLSEDIPVVIQITNSSGMLTNASVKPEVEIFMPAHGHGSSKVNVVALSLGLYRAEDLFFMMPGEWEIRVQLKNGETVLEQLVWTITL